jgi:hypothetical protein
VLRRGFLCGRRELGIGQAGGGQVMPARAHGLAAARRPTVLQGGPGGAVVDLPASSMGRGRGPVPLRSRRSLPQI